MKPRQFNHRIPFSARELFALMLLAREAMRHPVICQQALSGRLPDDKLATLQGKTDIFVKLAERRAENLHKEQLRPLPEERSAITV